MKKIWIAIACVVVLGAIIGLTGCSEAKPAVLAAEDLSNVEINVSSQQEGIWVNGSGKVSVTPDIALLSVGIEVQKETVAEAQAIAAEAMDNVIAALKDNGVKEEDIQTQQYSIRKISEWYEPIYDEGGKEEIVGYRVTNVVTAKIRDIDEVGTVIDTTAAAGGDYIRIDSIGFTVDDPMPYYEEARAQAVEYAKAKAEQLAQLSGVALGDPTYISESSYYPSPNYIRSDMAYESGAPAVETPISPGELEITANIQIVYDIIS